jgi:hypothetical protein
MNNGEWVSLHSLSPESMVTGDIDANLDDIIIDFGTGVGIWLRMNNSNWVQLHNLSPESMITGDIDSNGRDDIIIDFGPTYGIWLWMNNIEWVKLHSLSPESMVTGNIDGLLSGGGAATIHQAAPAESDNSVQLPNIEATELPLSVSQQKLP